jgi:DNA modification methylase/superfamily II DNA or RNA helicase
MKTYTEFLESKHIRFDDAGFDVDVEDIHDILFDYQRDITRWAIGKGRCALFEDVGLGKTIQFGEYMRQINKPTIIISPLYVAFQTITELKKLLDVEVRYIRSSDECDFDERKFYIINYDMIDHINPELFDVVILDESSILKNLQGKQRTKLIKMFGESEYRLCSTATPAPNDIAEIGNHAEFLGIMKVAQMKATFFVNDSKDMTWRIKKHAHDAFYQWLASWSVALTKPSDLGYSDEGFTKPEIRHHIITVDTGYRQEGKLDGFEDTRISATQSKKIRRTTIHQRANEAVNIINKSDDQFVVWCGLNDESDTLDKLIDDGVNVYGSMKRHDKIDSISSFINGDKRVLISKTKIAGMGVNMQNCKNMMWFGMDFSWEQFYQGIGRVARYGQASDHIDNYIVISEAEKGIVDIVFEKDKKASELRQNLINHMSINSEVKKNMTEQSEFNYDTDESSGKDWDLWLGDSVERMRDIPDNSMHLSVYSPPFNDVFVYSNTERDLGNSKNFDEFIEHYKYIIRENLRITLPGRIACVHLTELRALKSTHGYRGLIDFTGEVIKSYVDAGWIWRSRITIDKNPQALAIRTKDTDLQFLTINRDSANSAPMNTDYLLVFKKPGDNPIPIHPVKNGQMTTEDWISWAHAIWYDISETDVLNVRVAKGNNDEKHMCPLQLPLIDRCVRLWSNEGETVFSPFAGIGSEGYQSLTRGRKFHGIELKPEYFKVAQKNLNTALQSRKQISMFESADLISTEIV